MPAWHHWLHCTGSLYGQWLPGDHRGWRERDHHTHIDADYKHPLPPNAFDRLRKKSQDLMTRDPVSLTLDQRTAVCRELFNPHFSQLIEQFAIARRPCTL